MSNFNDINNIIDERFSVGEKMLPINIIVIIIISLVIIFTIIYLIKNQKIKKHIKYLIIFIFTLCLISTTFIPVIYKWNFGSDVWEYEYINIYELLIKEGD